MIHAQGVDGKSFEKVARKLSKHFHIYSVDCYGHGGSLHNPTEYNVKDIGRAIIDFIQNEIGQAAFVKATITADDGEIIPILTLGPICVANEYKRQGYGKLLLDFAFEKANEQGFGAVCFEGNIDFYGKCGCVKASNFGIRYDGMPDGEDADFFLCKILEDGYLDGIGGVYATPEVYFIDEKDVDAFDKTFTPKQKLKLPGQLF